MHGTVLREVYDENLNKVIRLRKLEDGRVSFTTISRGEIRDESYLIKPILAHIRVTDQCNLRCPYCYTRDGSSTEDLSFEALSDIVDMCDKEGIMGITWTGGEPFIKRHFPEIVRKTYKKNIRQTILTNGTLIPSNIEQLIPKDNIIFQVSLNNIWTDFQSNEVVFSNIKRLSSAGYSFLVTVLLQVADICQYERIIERLIESGAKYVRFGLEIPVGGSSREHVREYREHIVGMLPKLNEVREKYKSDIRVDFQLDDSCFNYYGFPRRFLNCEAGTLEFYIDNNGDTYPCPLLKSYEEFYCGNVMENAWMDIWNAEPMIRMRSVKQCSDCNRNCKVWCRALKYAEDNTLQGPSNYCLKRIYGQEK